MEASESALRDLADADLAARIAEPGGEPATAAEAELCRRYARRVYFYGLRHLGSEDMAHDLAQDVLLVVLEKVRKGEVRDPGKLGSFILGVARLQTRSGRRRAARSEPMGETEAARLAVDAAAPDPIAREHVARCLQQLEERQRTVLVLTFYAEQSTEQIASSFGLTTNNVRVIRHRGIASMRGCLGLDESGVAA